MIKRFLLDTNIISELSKAEPDSKILETFEKRKNICGISAVTLQELVLGIYQLEEGPRKQNLSEFLDTITSNLEIITYDEISATLCGKLLFDAQSEGKNISCYDSQIAATAIAKDMVLVTNRESDFKAIPDLNSLKIEDWSK